MPKNNKQHIDPRAEHEAGKYQSPIFSREYIQDFLKQRKRAANFRQISKEFGYFQEDHLEALRRRLLAMVRDGQLSVNARGGFKVIDDSDYISGVVLGHKDGFGFLRRDDGQEDLFLSMREMQAVFPSDKVLVSLAGVDVRGKRQAKVVRVVESKLETVVGRFYQQGDRAIVVPEDRQFAKDIEIDQTSELLPVHGQVVVVKITARPNKYQSPKGKLIEILGDQMDPGMETEVAMRQHGIPFVWSQAVLDEVALFPEKVPEAEKEGRTDLRSLKFVTIDGKDAKDFDDAVYAEQMDDGWKLYVAIADVSHYVQSGTALDQEAQARGNSVYFPRRVISMLPYQLSNGLCSLNPKVDRLAMVCEMKIDKTGKLQKNAKFFEAVIYSHARLTYKDVSGILEEDRDDLKIRHKPVLPQLRALYKLYKALHARREQRGAMDFDSTETQLVFDKKQKIKAIKPLVRNDAHRLIEECMLCANVSAAEYLLKHKSPALYRVHKGPTSEKLVKLRGYLASIGLALDGGDDPAPIHFAKLLEKIKARVDADSIRLVILRSLKQAVYTPENEGHFGLAYDAYGHFTSPIRRYPDLLVHRAIRAIIRKDKSLFRVNQKKMMEYGEHCSMTERRADTAVYDALDWLKCEFMLDRVGKHFSGKIAAVTSFGIFVALDDIYVEGLVHVTNLPKDYYSFDDVHHRMVGDRSGRQYALGDTVKVCVSRVDLDERQIDFELIERSHGR